MTFNELDEAGIVTAEQIDPPAEAGALPPGAVVFENNAFDIEATAPFSGPVLVAFTAADVSDPDVFARLRIFHNENGILIDRTLLPSDFASRTVRAQVGSLSPFVLALVDQTTNQPPSARCHDVELEAGETCSARIEPADVDDGSMDPEGGPISSAVDPGLLSGPGSHRVTLTVTDAQGAPSSCQATATVVDRSAPVLACPLDLTVSTAPGRCTASLTPGPPSVADNCPNVVLNGLRSDHAAVEDAYPVGLTGIAWTTTDASGNSQWCPQTVTVRDTEAPVIAGLSVDKPTLWPPSHDMIDVLVDYMLADNCGSQDSVQCTLSVRSNEPADGLGDGDTAPDWEILDARHLRLRAERSGAGAGRLYSIAVACADSQTNVATRTIVVEVPKDRR